MVLSGGLLALPGRQELVRADIRVSNGRIADISPSVLPARGEERIDLSGHHLFPGAIDPHVHFDTPGFEHREDFIHGSQAAARGGVTTVIDMPCTSLPPVTTLDNFRTKLDAIRSKSVVDFALFGGVSGAVIEDSLSRHMAELAPYVVGFKSYFISGMESFPRLTHYDFARAAAKADEVGRPLLLHAEDFDYIDAATTSARNRGGERWADYVAARPEAAELVAAASAAALARGHAHSLHVVHVGTADAAELLHAAGASCETCPHYLAFTSADFDRLGSSLKTAPPVKSPGERERLWVLLASGAISFAASDHAPAPAAEKHTGSIWTDYGGIPGTGTLFPYLYSEGYRAGRIGLPRFLEIVSGGAARRYGLFARKGSIEVGKDADLVAVDPEGSYTVRGTELLSKGTITPFEGMRLTGAVARTFLRGVAVWDKNEGILVDPGTGIYLQWGSA